MSHSPCYELYTRQFLASVLNVAVRIAEGRKETDSLKDGSVPFLVSGLTDAENVT